MLLFTAGAVVESLSPIVTNFAITPVLLLYLFIQRNLTIADPSAYIFSLYSGRYKTDQMFTVIRSGRLPADPFKNLTSCTRFSWSNDDFPSRKFCFQITLQNRYFTRNDQFSGFNLRFNILFDILGDAVPENLPAAQDVSTESPPASLITRLSGTPERSSSPDTTKYVRAKSTVVTTTEFSSAPVQRIDAWLYFHWLLRVSVNVLTQTE